MSFGFIMLRHVNSEETNKYWIESYSCIRSLYPDNMIIIIDDSSNYVFITEIPLINTLIIQSEFKGRAELLPYIYYLNGNYFDTAVILHDSVFIKKYIDFTDHQNKYIWKFEHEWDETTKELELLSYLDNSEELITFYEKKHKWNGCFGAMSVINHSFLKKIDAKYTLKNLIPHINNRKDRMAFERVISVLISITNETTTSSVLGDIHEYISWNYSYDEYIQKLVDRPVYKVWTGR